MRWGMVVMDIWCSRVMVGVGCFASHIESYVSAQSGGRYSSPYPPNLPRFSVPPGTTVLKMRGLPYHAGESHILEFFRDYPVTIMLIPKAPAGSRPKGEAYVEFGSAEAASIALRQRNGASMDQRYIELFPSSMSEAKEAAGSR
eukprot:GHVN01037552.1.p1 GENE.GHVN01037552.1~~GHVN01037552.1.p1  ORF type:complete len:144 (-),score=7.93 GHVN01037552.1:119-550(-)